MEEHSRERTNDFFTNVPFPPSQLTELEPVSRRLIENNLEYPGRLFPYKGNTHVLLEEIDDTYRDEEVCGGDGSEGWDNND